MVDSRWPGASFANEAQCRCEDSPPFLSSLNCSRYEALTVSYSFDMVQNWNSRVSGKNKIAVHAMDEEDSVAIGRRRWWNSLLSRREALSDHSTTVNTTSAWRVPELPIPVRCLACILLKCSFANGFYLVLVKMSSPHSQ